MSIWVDVYDASGNRLGDGPVNTIQNVSVQRLLDGSGTIDFTVPATDHRALTLLTVRRRIRVFIEGRELCRGVVLSRKFNENASGATYTFTCADSLILLKDYNALLGRSYQGVTLQSAMTSLIGLASGWGVSVESGVQNKVIDARLDGTSVLKALRQIADSYGVHFRLGSGNVVEVGAFGQVSSVAAMNVATTGIELYKNPNVVVIEEIEAGESGEEIVNWLLPLGAGESAGALKLKRSTRTTPYAIQNALGPDGRRYWYIQDSASTTTYGQTQRVVTFKAIAPIKNNREAKINAANALYDAAVAYLQRMKAPRKNYRVRLRNVKQAFKPGDKINVRYKGRVTRGGAVVDYVNIDANFWILRVEERYDLSGHDVTLEISDVDINMDDGADLMISTMEDMEIRNLKPLMNANRYTMVYYQDIAKGYKMVVPLPLTEATLELIRVRIRLKTFTYNYGIGGSTDTAKSISIRINGVNRTTELGGPFAVNGGEIDVLLNSELITGFLENDAGGLYQEHKLDIRCQDGKGRIQLEIEVYEICQSIDLDSSSSSVASIQDATFTKSTDDPLDDVGDFDIDKIIRVYNDTGATIEAVKVVRVDGAESEAATVVLAQADSTANADGVVGVTMEAIADGAYGRVQLAGRMENVDTSALSIGEVFIDESTPGDMTNTAPTVKRRTGFVLVSDASSGVLLVDTGEVGTVAPDIDDFTDAQHNHQNAAGGGTLNAAAIAGGTLDNARVNFASPSAIGSGTPAAGTFTTLIANTTLRTGDGSAGAKAVEFKNANTGTLSWNPTATRTLTLPDATDTLVGRATTDTLTNKTLTTPTIGSFTNAQHNHQNAAGGGSLDAAAIGSGTLNNARVNFASPSAIGSTTPAAGTFSELAVTGTAASAVVVTTYADIVRQVFSRANGSSGSPSQVLNNEFLMTLSARGYHNGGAFGAVSAFIGMQAAENFSSATNLGTQITFFTTPAGSGTAANRMTIEAGGNVDIVNLLRAGGVRVDADPGSGVASTLTLTSATDTPTASLTWTGVGNPNGYIKAYIGTQAIVIPYWNT